MTDLDKPEKRNPWDSDLKVVSQVLAEVPMLLLLVCNHIAERVDDNEFSIVTNIADKTIDRVVLSADYYVPKQQVTPGSIDYLQDEYHHSVVIHRHPDGHDSFSTTDREYINQNFELSLLYTKKDKFVGGVYNLKLEDAVIPIPVKIHITDGLEDIDITNIDAKRNELRPMRMNYRQDEPESEFLYSADDMMTELKDLNARIEMLESYFYR